MSTEFYADYIKKTTFDPDTSSVRQKFTAVKADDVEVEINVEEEEQLQEAATDTKKKPASKTPKVEVPATEIPEELHGDQDKLDHNKDKKISASDMKMVRKHGPVKEEEELEEGTFKVDVEGLPTMYIDGSVGEIKASLRKKLKDPKAIVSVERITPAEKKKELRAKVAEDESVDEAKRVVHSDRSDSLASVRVIKPKDPKTFNQDKNYPPHLQGDSIGKAKAAFKKTKVSEDQAAIDAYLKKGGTIKKLPPAHARSSSDMENDVKGRVDTSRFKTKGKVKSMEDVEQVSEISKRAKAAYVRVAARDLHHQGSKAAQGVANNDREAIKKADRNIDNRLQGIDRATKGLQKEGAMKRIATNDAEKERLGPRKVKGDGLDTFKKKPVSELNRDTLGSYISKASDASKHKGMPTKKVDNRYAGVAKASKKIDKMEEGKRGLWDNIHAKRARGEKPNPPGHPDRPSAADLKRSQNNEAADYPDQRKHLKTVGSGGSVSYTHKGETMTGKYGGMKNRGGKSYAMVHHDSHSAMVPLPNIKHK